MKNLILIILCLSPAICIAQDTLVYPHLQIDSTTKLYACTDIEKVTGTAKEELFSKANEWVALAFRSAKDVIQMNDKEAGKIIAKGVLDTAISYKMTFNNIINYYLSFTCNFTIKAGRYRVVISDFHVQNYGSNLLDYQKVPFYVTPQMEREIYAYNHPHKKKHWYDDDDGTDGYMTTKRKAKIDAAILTQIDFFVKNIFLEIKSAMTNGDKDNF